jgi:hypothetical protein
VTRRTSALAALALLVLTLVGLALMLRPAPAEAVQPAPAPAVVHVTPETPDAFLRTLVGDGTHLPPNAEELSLAADRVCEGITAGVPVMVMADTAAAQLALTDEEARHLVNTAAVTRCVTPAH